jgi:hypothetical protein
MASMPPSIAGTRLARPTTREVGNREVILTASLNLTRTRLYLNDWLGGILFTGRRAYINVRIHAATVGLRNQTLLKLELLLACWHHVPRAPFPVRRSSFAHTWQGRVCAVQFERRA